MAMVTDETVLERMDGMKTMSEQLKVLGAMAKGERNFDSAAVETALARLTEEAARIPAQFEKEVIVPKSEALPEIRENREDFTEKAETLETRAVAMSVSEAADLGSALRRIGGACKSCHGDYRE